MTKHLALFFFLLAFVLVIWFFPCQKLPESWCDGVPWCDSSGEELSCVHVKNT